MSGYLALTAAGDALRQVLWAAFETDSRILRHVGSPEQIVSGNPAQAAANTDNRLSVWLYHVSQDPLLRNDVDYRADRRAGPPLTLMLHYLVTPLTPTGEADLMLLGKVLQVFNDTPVINLLSPLDDISEELRVVLETMEQSEVSRIWEAMQGAYRLSVSYQVRVARIDAAATTPTAPIISRFGDWRGAAAA